MSNQEKRKRRIEKIFNSVRECSDASIGCDEKKLIGVLGVEMGLSKRIIKEYVRQLIDAELIEEIKGELWIKKPQA